MKKIIVSVVLVAILGGIGFYLWKNNQSEKMPVIKKDDKVPEKKPQPPQEEEKALTFWCGEIIVGDSTSEWWGYVELLGHPGRKSKILVVDKDGICRFDSIPGMTAGEMYLRFKGWEKPPTFSLAEFNKGKEQPTHAVYQLNKRAKERPLGALITHKAIGYPLTELRPRQEGQFFEGQTWSLASHNRQVFGRE